MNNRAYSMLEIKAINEDDRIIDGIATTPSTDRMGDVVNPKGASFKLPIPLLWQHDSSQPIGHVEAAKVTDGGITIRARIVRISEPGRLKDRLDEAWQSIKSGLVRGLSIGFRPTEDPKPIKGTYGLIFDAWELMELSAVTIPANSDANITAIKSADQLVCRAMHGARGKRIVRRLPAGNGFPVESGQRQVLIPE